MAQRVECIDADLGRGIPQASIEARSPGLDEIGESTGQVAEADNEVGSHHLRFRAFGQGVEETQVLLSHTGAHEHELYQSQRCGCLQGVGEEVKMINSFAFSLPLKFSLLNDSPVGLDPQTS